MRPNQNRRMRGRSRPKGPNPLTRSYESNGPDVKVRGTAQHVADKYAQLARDAQASGDPVAAENYLQHAEHYYRIIATAQEQYREQFGSSFQRPFDEEGEDESGGFGFGGDRSSGDDGDPTLQPFDGRQDGGERPDRARFDRGDRFDNRDRSDRGERPDRVQGQDRGQDRGQGQDRAPDRGGERFDRQDRGGGGRDRFQRPDRNRQDFGRSDQRSDGQRQDGPRQDGPRQDGPRQDGPRHDGPRHDGPRQDGSRHDGRRFEGRRPDQGRDEFQRPGNAFAEGGRPEGRRPDSQRDDVPRQDFGQPEPRAEQRPARDDQPRPDRAPPRREVEAPVIAGLPAFLTNPVRTPIAVGEPEAADAPAESAAPEVGGEANGAFVRPRRRRRRPEGEAAPESAVEGVETPPAE